MRCAKKVYIIETESELLDVQNNYKELPSFMHIIGDQHVLFEKSIKPEYVDTNGPFHNPVLASFITGFARLELLKYLELMGAIHCNFLKYQYTKKYIHSFLSDTATQVHTHT